MVDITPDQIQDALKTAEIKGLLTKSSVENIRTWVKEPQFDEYVPEIIHQLKTQNYQELDNAFWEVVNFGTGGRRGRMGTFGCATINDRTIAESAHGLAVYWKKTAGDKSGSAVVACDTRNNSDHFARLTASVLAAHGLKVYLFDSFRSTPELSFAVRHLKCDVGVMISASHNPPSDNGFKAYWSTGGQVLAPHDKGIIECVYESKFIPSLDFDQAIGDGKIKIIGTDVDEAYYQTVLALSLSDERELPAIFTPLHGVGETCCYQILRRAGFAGIEILESQRTPDGDFPNVSDNFPNPERREVFLPAMDRGRETGAEILLASDPDADRLGVCVRNADGQYIHLTGNQIGTIIADYILRKRSARGDLTPEHFVVETLVTTPLIGDIAKSHGVKVVDDLLVGFKYIGQAMDQHGPDKFVFGAEESLGYLAGSYARDKDAGIASLYFAECAAELRKEGKTILDRLDELYTEHGYYIESQMSKVCTGPKGKEQIQGLMRALRESPPEQLGDVKWQTVRDYNTHEVRGFPGNVKTEDLPQPSGDVLMFISEPSIPSIRMAIRPSGTEPKIKFYFFARSEVVPGMTLANTRIHAHDRLDDFKNQLSNWIEEQLAKSA